MENIKQQKLSIPAAIVVAGFIIMVAILITNRGGNSIGNDTKNKTLSEQVGVSKEALTSCIKSIDQSTLTKNIQTSVESAMSGVPAEKRGTPYSVIIGKNGVKTEILGADTIDNVKKLITEVNSGTVTTKYTGNIPPVDATDHVMGDPSTATVTIVEYSDYECPYCARFQPILEQVVKESNGSVAWVYRHWPIHQNSLAKLEAAECISKLKGSDAFWKYSDLLFGLIQTQANPVTDQL